MRFSRYLPRCQVHSRTSHLLHLSLKHRGELMIKEPEGGGSEPQKELSRPSAKEIYVQVAGNAGDD